jgi:[acyl-carrier-protein] S-malonyltransferase
LFVANINSPNQAVIAGNTEAVDRAIELLKRRCEASDQVESERAFSLRADEAGAGQAGVDLERLIFNEPEMPVVTNVDARIRRA